MIPGAISLAGVRAAEPEDGASPAAGRRVQSGVREAFRTRGRLRGGREGPGARGRRWFPRRGGGPTLIWPEHAAAEVAEQREAGVAGAE